MLNKLLIALGLREKPRRSQLTMWTYDKDSGSVIENRSLRKLLQTGDRWHQIYTDDDGSKVHNEFIWYGNDETWRLHNWSRTKENDGLHQRQDG
jgi:hypothetical protein